MKNSIVIFAAIILFSCSEPEPRKPITHKKSTSFFEESIELNKKILKNENAKFKYIIDKDSMHNYMASPYGFWYYYNHKIVKNTPKPKTGNQVVIHYEIKNLYNEIILSKEQLGTKEQENKKDRLVKIDGEDFILGLHEGIKLLKVGEEITFLMPSNKAFGATGLNAIISPNEPLIITVKLVKINKNKINK